MTLYLYNWNWNTSSQLILKLRLIKYGSVCVGCMYRCYDLSKSFSRLPLFRRARTSMAKFNKKWWLCHGMIRTHSHTVKGMHDCMIVRSVMTDTSLMVYPGHTMWLQDNTLLHILLEFTCSKAMSSEPRLSSSARRAGSVLHVFVKSLFSSMPKTTSWLIPDSMQFIYEVLRGSLNWLGYLWWK